MNIEFIILCFFCRCYNCGEFTNHIAANCELEPQQKKCHHCKSSSHLVADCPTKEGAAADTSKETHSTWDEWKNKPNFYNNNLWVQIYMYILFKYSIIFTEHGFDEKEKEE